VPGGKDVGDLGGAAGGPLEAQRGRLTEELGMAAHHPGVGADAGSQPVEAAIPVRTQPAVEGVAADRAGTAVRPGVGAGGHLADQETSLGGAEVRADRLGDEPEAPQGDALGVLRGHLIPPRWGFGAQVA
jgi:hypothetical protein